MSENKYRNRMSEYSHEKIKNDEYYTSREEVEYIFEKVIPEGFLKDKIIYCPCDSEESEFVKYLKENKDRYEYKEFIYTWDDFNTHVDLFEYADFVITNPPFSKIKRQLLPILENHTKYWFIFHSIPAIMLHYKYFIYRAPHFYFNTPHVLFKDNSHKTTISHIYVSNFECNIVVKANQSMPNKTFNELYKDKEPVYGYLLSEPENKYLTIDRIKDIPIDYKELMLVPMTILLYDNKQNFQIITELFPRNKNTKYTDNKQRFIRSLVKWKI